jgi:hypothetical protein
VRRPRFAFSPSLATHDIGRYEIHKATPTIHVTSPGEYERLCQPTTGFPPFGYHLFIPCGPFIFFSPFSSGSGIYHLPGGRWETRYARFLLWHAPCMITEPSIVIHPLKYRWEIYQRKKGRIYKAHNKRWSVYTLLLAPVHRPSVQVPSIWSIPIDTDERGVYTLHTADEVLCVWHQIRHVVLYSADAIHMSSMGSIFVYTSSLFISFFLNPDWIWCL